MGRRAKNAAVVLRETAATPSLTTVAELVESAAAAHRQRRHHIASVYLQAAHAMLVRLREAERGPPAVARAPMNVRREVVRVVLELEPRAWHPVAVVDVRAIVAGRLCVTDDEVVAALRELDRRLVVTLREDPRHDPASGVWVNGRGFLTVVSRARAYWRETSRPYVD